MKKQIIILFIIIIIFCLVYGYVIHFLVQNSEWPNFSIRTYGSWGDSFNILSALFSGLAFGGIILTFWQQQKQIERTDAETKLLRFKDIFFRMLMLHTDMVNSMEYKSFDESKEIPSLDYIKTHINNFTILVRGKECFEKFYECLKLYYGESKKEEASLEDIDLIKKSFEKFLQEGEYQAFLGHYFRFLYRIFKFINDEKYVSEDDRNFYGAIARAQLSNHELALVFYNCLSEYGLKFKLLAEKFRLFDNLPLNLLMEKSHANLYEEEAWGDNSNYKYWASPPLETNEHHHPL